jgi:hypothetical protein
VGVEGRGVCSGNRKNSVVGAEPREKMKNLKIIGIDT